MKKIPVFLLVLSLSIAQFTFTAYADPDNRITAPINIDGVVCTCDLEFGDYIINTGSSTLPDGRDVSLPPMFIGDDGNYYVEYSEEFPASNNLPNGGSVCLPLTYLGSDGVYYPVKESELQGTPDELGLSAAATIKGTGFELSAPTWQTWDNGHYFAEYIVTNTTGAPVNVSFDVNLSQAGITGETKTFSGIVDPSVDVTVIDAQAGAAVGNTISSVIYLKLAGNIQNVYGEFTLGASSPVKAEPVKVTDGEMEDYYSFTLTDIYSQKMSDVITFKLMQGEGEDASVIWSFDETNNFSIASYCDILAATTKDEAILTLLANMLEYGAASQRYVNYNTENPANKSAWVEENRKTYDFENAKTEILVASGKGSAVISSALLTLKDKVNLCVVVKAAGTDNVKIKVTGKGTEEILLTDDNVIAQGNGTYLVYISDLLPYEYDTTFIISAVEGEETVNSVSYSVNVYLNNKKNSANSGLADIVAAINNYEYAAKACLK